MSRPDFDHEWVEYGKTAPGEIVEWLHGASIVITNKVPLSAETLAALPDLEMIAVAATGFNIIDIETCRARDIVVSNIRGYAVNTVPEHTFAPPQHEANGLKINKPHPEERPEGARLEGWPRTPKPF